MNNFGNAAQVRANQTHVMSVQIFEGRKVFVWQTVDCKKVMIVSALNVDYFPPRTPHTAVRQDEEEIFYSNNTGGHGDFNYWRDINLPKGIQDKLRDGDGFRSMPDLLYASSFDEGDEVRFFWPAHFHYEFEEAIQKSIEKENGQRLDKFTYGGQELEPFVGIIADTVMPEKWDRTITPS